MANPKAADFKALLEVALLEVTPVTLQALLNLSSPEKYRAQKGTMWKSDLEVLLALGVTWNLTCVKRMPNSAMKVLLLWDETSSQASLRETYVRLMVLMGFGGPRSSAQSQL